MEQSEARSQRSYNQYCAVARGLDIVGERWTLLIIRDLLVGPKRYKDLQDGLPGIGTNLLAARLRDLEQHGLVRRTVLPPPAGSTVYELTETGQALEPTITTLGRWGARFMGTPRDSDSYPIDAYLIAMRASFKPEAAAGLTETYELRVGGRVFEIRIDNGQCTITQGSSRAPDAVLTLDVFTLNGLLKQGWSPSEAMAEGRVKIEGDTEALQRFVQLFTFHPHEDRRSDARRPATGSHLTTRK